MAEVITIEDLQDAKTHEIFHAECITGRSGGVAGGAEINTATNPITGQVQTTFPKILADYVDTYGGTFTDGFTIQNRGQLFYFESGGQVTAYKWAGSPLALTVAAGSAPSDYGTIGTDWVDKTDVALRSDINIVQKRFACVADMISDTTLAVGQIVETIGYYNGWAATASKPKGGNRYEIVTASTGTADGGSFISLSNGLQAKALFVDGKVTVERFGAKVDGLTDDTTSWQNALSYSPIVEMGLGVSVVTDGLEFTNKTVKGARRPSSLGSSNGSNINFVASAAKQSTPTATIGGFYHIEDIAIYRTGDGKRGIILNVTSGCERTSGMRNVVLARCTRCFNSSDSSNHIYSNHFIDVELGDYTLYGMYIDDAGATGNVFDNIYSSNWATYPTTKNTAISAIFFTGDNTENEWGQVNIEHGVYSSAPIVLNGIESANIGAIHFEGVELGAGLAFTKIISGGVGFNINIETLSIEYCTLTGNNVSIASITTLSGDTVDNLRIGRLNARNNSVGSTSGHRRFIREGTIYKGEPSITVEKVSSDIFTGNDYLPLANESYKPILRKWGESVYFSEQAGVPVYAPASAAPTSGKYLRGGIVNNSAITSSSARGWQNVQKGNFANPVVETGGVVTVAYNSAVTVGATTYAFFSIGDSIRINGVDFYITNKYTSGGNIFVLGTNPSTSGTYDAVVPSPSFVNIAW